LLLEPLEKATKLLSASSYPTMGDTRFVFECIQSHLGKQMLKDNFTQRDVAASISQKLAEYWRIMDGSSIASAILDPRIKLSIFTEETRQSACEHIKVIFETYQENSSNASSPMRRISTSTTNVSRQYFTQLLQGAIPQVSTSVTSTHIASELDRYLALQADDEADPLLWWQAHAKEYPIVSDMARDYLTIPATSVPSEQAFSVAGNTISKTRNRLLPETARACLCMKSWIINKIGD
jgi:hypothetical protein